MFGILTGVFLHILFLSTWVQSVGLVGTPLPTSCGRPLLVLLTTRIHQVLSDRTRDVFHCDGMEAQADCTQFMNFLYPDVLQTLT